jgi:hypothetical protein
MNESSDIKFEQPSIIQSLLSGFNTIANKPYLMVLPILLDLFLWFGPSWRVDDYFKPLLEGFSGLQGLESGEYSEIFGAFQSMWQDIFSNLDLAFSLHTFPIGVPSLMVSKPPFINPLGQPFTINLISNLQVMGFWLLFLLIGFSLGSLYFKNISNQIIKIENKVGLRSFFKTLLQVLLMPLIMIFILLILAVPFLIILTLVSLISPAIGEFFILITGVILLWVLMPLIFTPHSIFLFKQNLIGAMMTSISVVKTSMGRTAWFILLSYVLIEGMNYLWRIPSADNWFLVFGIFGHAFMVTAVIAASFYYYIDATKFTQSVMNQKMKPA